MSSRRVEDDSKKQPGAGPVMSVDSDAPPASPPPGYDKAGGFTLVVELPPGYTQPNMTPLELATNMPKDVSGFHNWYKADGTRSGPTMCRPKTTPGRRLILDLIPSSSIPPEIAAHGVSQEDWTRVTGELIELIRSKEMSICSHIWCILGCLPIWCCINAGAQKAYGAWIARVNEEVFEPRGLLLKLQASSFQVQTGRELANLLLLSFNKYFSEL
ncbi:hypothetical protein HK101_007116 [Irineochytrium annulatum]|nr:hypothetical protein HK101_007116 [Irineochytrium annulatum]